MTTDARVPTAADVAAAIAACAATLDAVDRMMDDPFRIPERERGILSRTLRAHAATLTVGRLLRTEVAMAAGDLPAAVDPPRRGVGVGEVAARRIAHRCVHALVTDRVRESDAADLREAIEGALSAAARTAADVDRR